MHMHIASSLFVLPRASERQERKRALISGGGGRQKLLAANNEANCARQILIWPRASSGPAAEEKDCKMQAAPKSTITTQRRVQRTRRTWPPPAEALMLLLLLLALLVSVPMQALQEEPAAASEVHRKLTAPSSKQQQQKNAFLDSPIDAPNGNMSSAQQLASPPGFFSGVPRARFSMPALAAPSDQSRVAQKIPMSGQGDEALLLMINGELLPARRLQRKEAQALELATRNKLARQARSSAEVAPTSLFEGAQAPQETRKRTAAAATQLIDNKSNNKMTNDSKRKRRMDERQASDEGESLELEGAIRSLEAPQEEEEHNKLEDNEEAVQLPPEVTRNPLDEEEAALVAKSSGELKCRVEKDLYLDFEEYRHYTCANCYNQVPPEYFKNKLALTRLEERVVKLRDRDTDELIWSNESRRIRATFKDEEKFVKWRICCHEAVACCHSNARHLPQTSNSLGQLIDDSHRLDECPGTWDGLSCWPPSPAGQLAWRTCPRVAYLLDFEPACRGYVTKQCFPNASWFINRNGHEWSDYSTCSPEGLYKARMLHAAVAYVCEALIVTPALLIIGKFPNRGGNKRIRIMKSLLFYILMNSLIQALQRGFLAAGFFAEYRGGPVRPDHHAPKSAASLASAAARLALPPNSSTFEPHQSTPESGKLVAVTAASLLMLSNASTTSGTMTQAPPRVIRATPASRGWPSLEQEEEEELNDRENALIGHIFERKDARHETNWTRGGPEVGQNSSIRRRVRRNVTSAAVDPTTRARNKRSESAWKAIFCWLLQMASRLVRLMGYAWMFTGGVYLCSALHFAPAEPPVKFIKILFFLTNAFPNLIFFAYVTARTINEPSPLNIILKVPYFWLQGDLETVDYLCSTQKVCWFEESKSERIESIADLPNLILVASNVILFVITLVILCRINRPGSTRPDTSPCAYFKAAGTLLFLYGGHYFFLAYRPESESCSVDTFMFYAFICIDVVQGIAISIVFCYMTQEGKTVISKYWRTRQRFLLVRQFTWMGCMKDKDKFAENGYHHSALHTSNRFNQSTRSNQSGCNGHNDNVTEFININDAQMSGQF